jgi:hypothetical protein
MPRSIVTSVQPSSETLLAIIRRKIVFWLLFNVVVALLPLAFRLLAGKLQRSPWNFERTLYDGDLLLVAGAIAAGAVGEMVATAKRMILSKLVVAALCVLSLMASCLLYAFISAKAAGSLDSGILYHCSLWTFGVTFVGGFCAIILSEV